MISSKARVIAKCLNWFCLYKFRKVISSGYKTAIIPNIVKFLHRLHIFSSTSFLEQVKL